MKPMPPAVERWNLNNWTTREVPSPPFFSAFHVSAHGTPIQTAAPGKTARSSSVQAFMGDLVSQLITCRGALWHRSLSSCLSGLQVTSNICGHIQMLSWTVLLASSCLGPQNWRAEQSAKLGSTLTLWDAAAQVWVLKDPCRPTVFCSSTLQDMWGHCRHLPLDSAASTAQRSQMAVVGKIPE